ncbi:uncharacterized protein LOC131166554 [Malania oleifera]|uniref:uncharacterized protein LOC131166554 n=1 Tax=Malania oleifera TaxID=397392 RepID=UPI0025ADD695|nr:uncharacterized protein LOC131166554 [Malania oleifera]
MQLKKGLIKGEQTYLATVVVDEEVGKELVLTTIQAALGEYKGVMPNKLPHELPPLRGVEHEIKLFPRLKPPAKGPYRITPPEWNWTKEYQGSFDDFKDAIMRDLVLTLPDVMKPFEVQIDASDFALRGVLVQDGHPVAYESHKLSEVEQKYTA